MMGAMGARDADIPMEINLNCKVMKENQFQLSTTDRNFDIFDSYQTKHHVLCQ